MPVQVDKVRETFTKFFALPEDIKKKLTRTAGINYGYVPMLFER